MYRYKKIKLSDGTTRDEHVLIMEEYLGRLLESDECVHHCNEHKKQNDIENLELMLRTEHSKEHMAGHISTSRKFSDKQVQKIRSSSFGCRILARKYNVSPSTIKNIRSNKTYKNASELSGNRSSL